jgi:hypothetical protein
VHRPSLHTLGRVLVKRPWRYAAAPAYEALIAAELAAERARDRVTPAPTVKLDDLTIVVKTFERPRSVRRFIASVRRVYPTVRIVVVDDSRAPILHEGAETFVLPYDSGVSAGRAAGLAQVDTPFFLQCDDDHVFSHRTRIGPVLERMRAHPELDVVGGRLLNLPFFVPDVLETTSLGTIAGLERRLVAANFFVGRTDRVRLVGWDPALKRVDHTDFFLRAKGILAVAEDPQLTVLHAKTPFDAGYMAHRLDIERDLVILAVRHGAREAE